MIPIPINEAEAMFAPFFDGGDSDMRTDKACRLDEFEVRPGTGCAARAEQTWCSVDVVIDRAAVGAAALTLTSRTPLPIAGYDVFRVFACQPPYVRLRLTGKVDGREVVILDGHSGDGGMQEIDGVLAGTTLDTFSLEFSVLEARPARVALRWLGLANRAAQTRLEARQSPYTPEWRYCLAPDSALPQPTSSRTDSQGKLVPGPEPEPRTPNPKLLPAPALDLLFGANELASLRQQCLSGPLKPMADALRRQAEVYLKLEPEKMVGYLVPSADIRWQRVRDNWKTTLYHKMEPLALMGLIDRNPDFSRMAARMALSVSHCTHWCESPMGVHPGATWHHRSFQETYYTAACALVLDWAGAWLTPHGKQVIQDAIVMKGLPRMESDFRRMEYIRYMNQGIVFSIGRILGLLALIPSYPRYASQLAEAERDLHEMIDNYILDDGVILEGPGYWAHSFFDIVPLYYVLARHHGRSLKDYATEKVRRTGDYALSLLSTRGKGTGYIGINDAHNQANYPLNTLVAFSLMTDRPEWKHLLAAQVGGGEADAFSLVMAGCSGLDLAAAAVPSEPRTLSPEPSPSPSTLHHQPSTINRLPFSHFPLGGQAASVRPDPEFGAVHLHLCSGPTYPCHYHEDKGSIILEAAGQALIIDRGVLAYHEAENAFLGRAAAHSLLYPEPLADGVPFAQPGARPALPGGRKWGVFDLERAYGAKLGTGIEDDGLLLLASDNAGAWPDGLFSTNRRRICSPAPTLFLIEDVIEAGQPLEMSFRLHTPQNVEVRGREAWIRAPGVTLRVAALNWTPSAVDTAACSIDDQHCPVNLVRLVSAKAPAHRLLTALELLPESATAGRWKVSASAGGMRADYSGVTLAYDLAGESGACVRLRRGLTERTFRGTADWQAQPCLDGDRA